MSQQPASLSITTDIQYLPGVGPERADRLRRLGIAKVRDLLFFFPRDYERSPPERPIGSIRSGRPATVTGTITDTGLTSSSPGKSLFAAIVENDTGAVRIVFFNQPFRAEQITYGQRVRISGVAKLKGLRLEFAHPEVTDLGGGDGDGETVGDGPGDAAISRSAAGPRDGVAGVAGGPARGPSPATIRPIYPLTEGIRQTDLRRWTWKVTSELAESLADVLPRWLRRRAQEMLRAADEAGEPSKAPEDAGVSAAESANRRVSVEGESLPPIDEAIRWVHHPPDEASLSAARRRFVFQELLVMQLALAMRRRGLTTALRAPPLPPSPIIHARIVNRFPFDLTGDQRRAIEEIGRDLSRQFPMNRLLQGDVGSGKTVVALYAMLLAVAHRHQAALMAPTEVLARQHYQTLRRMLADSRVRIGLLVGSMAAAARRDTLAAIGSGDIDVLIGTQALLHADIRCHRLGLCVIDEQHKFGVRQRFRLRGADSDPHTLVMSATPIPRSIAMTLFGDVDLTTLRERPPGRGEVNTYLARDQWEERWWGFVRQHLDEGRQAFVVAPRIETGEPAGIRESGITDDVVPPLDAAVAKTESDAAGEDVASVRRTFAALSRGPLARYRLALLHGRMSPAEKQQVMEAFRDGEVQVLVSTTVIEVGIDVPNATLMTILGANRFGLAQLHQLRGRVGRGSHAGHVCLFTDGPDDPEACRRLEIFRQTDDGFALAEADFRLRGPGDLLGWRQSGMPELRAADLNRDRAELSVARALAQDLIDADPRLEAEDLRRLRRQVLRRYGKRLDLGDVA